MPGQLKGAGAVDADVHHLDLAMTGFPELVKQLDAGGQQAGIRLGPAGQVLGGEEGALHMAAPDGGALVALLLLQLRALIGVTDAGNGIHRGQKRGGTALGDELRQAHGVLQAGVGPKALIAVNVDVDKAGRDYVIAVVDDLRSLRDRGGLLGAHRLNLAVGDDHHAVVDGAVAVDYLLAL